MIKRIPFRFGVYLLLLVSAGREKTVLEWIDVGKQVYYQVG
jgi:hypothetical protein